MCTGEMQKTYFQVEDLFVLSDLLDMFGMEEWPAAGLSRRLKSRKVFTKMKRISLNFLSTKKGCMENLILQ